ncbi:hypothetical protein VCR12J2_560098 [Vibrio coralliirubri]|nr:hypothetical protein VCR12J2_560098 [Vibrio coralliirubri]
MRIFLKIITVSDLATTPINDNDYRYYQLKKRDNNEKRNTHLWGDLRLSGSSNDFCRNANGQLVER